MNTERPQLKSFLMFLIPSLIGIFLFMTPIQYKDQITIPIAIFSNFLQDLLAGYLPLIMTGIISLTFLITLAAKIIPSKTGKPNFYRNLFDVHPIWVIIRGLGMVFAVMTLLEKGPEAVTSGNTGGLLLNDLLPVLFAVFLFAGMFLPLLLNFGLLELCGALLTRIMRPIFTLPGRSSIDCMASWMGDGTIGVLLTSKQYEEGYYTKREAAVIGTTFSVVSITFSLVVLSQVGLEDYFVPYYLTILAAGFVAALICPRIPPLSKKTDTFYNKEQKGSDEAIPKGYSPMRWGLLQASKKAEKNKSLKGFLLDGVKNILDMWMGVAPIVMALGTLALIIAEYTPVFEWLGMPFIPFLQLLQVPEAAEASKTLVVGFADMFLPSVIATGIESDITRFIVACVSVTQLIYMSEVGGLLLGSKIPISIKELFIIFIERTIITLPVITLCAHIIF
ncbi:YjiH family protein [Bacillus tianshenii]|nr:YjiH family protein [Bacillus tianshenii]